MGVRFSEADAGFVIALTATTVSPNRVVLITLDNIVDSPCTLCFRAAALESTATAAT